MTEPETKPMDPDTHALTSTAEIMVDGKGYDHITTESLMDKHLRDAFNSGIEAHDKGEPFRDDGDAFAAGWLYGEKHDCQTRNLNA